MIRWKRSSGNFVESHDGRWRITPNYCGCTRPQDYALWHDDELITSYEATQRAAKETAENHKP